MIEYIPWGDATIVADYAVDEHPYDKTPGKPETFSEFNQGWHDACDFIRERIDALAPANVAPVRHGKWVDCGDEYGSYERCSICGDEFENWEADGAKTFYCPNCGARMDGGNENETD